MFQLEKFLKVPNYWPYVRGTPSDRVGFPHKGKRYGKHFHIMPSTCCLGVHRRLSYQLSQVWVINFPKEAVSYSVRGRDRFPDEVGNWTQRMTYKRYYFQFNWPLQWRHNERNGVSNHRSPDCLLNRLFRRRLKERSKLLVTGLCEGNPPVTGGFPSQRASNAEMFPFDMTSSWLPTSRGKRPPPTVCSEPWPSLAPQWKWNCMTSYVPGSAPPEVEKSVGPTVTTATIMKCCYRKCHMTGRYLDD